MNKWSELRETIRELHDNNADKPDVVGVTGFLLNLMNVKDRDCDLLKEQKPVKPVLDERTGRIWLCGNCGSYVGFEDHDENDPNEFDNFCRKCGRPVLWEGR